MRKLFLFIFVFASCSLIGQVSTWDYPTKPGSEKWKSLKSHTEMVELCQIPDTIIHSLSTTDLTRICLDYPLFFSMTAFTNMQEGFEQVSSEFNGFVELYQRKDFAKELLVLYQSIKPDDVKRISTDLDKGRFMFRTFYLEIMLAQNNVFKCLSDNDLNELIIESLQKSKQKQESNYSVFQTQATFLVMGRILVFKKNEGFVKKISTNPNFYNAFLKTAFLEDISILTEIRNSATDLINSLKD